MVKNAIASSLAVYSFARTSNASSCLCFKWVLFAITLSGPLTKFLIRRAYDALFLEFVSFWATLTFFILGIVDLVYWASVTFSFNLKSPCLTVARSSQCCFSCRIQTFYFGWSRNLLVQSARSYWIFTNTSYHSQRGWTSTVSRLILNKWPWADALVNVIFFSLPCTINTVCILRSSACQAILVTTFAFQGDSVIKITGKTLTRATDILTERLFWPRLTS